MSSGRQAASSSGNNNTDTFQPPGLSSSGPLQSDVARPIRAPWATPAAGTATPPAAGPSRRCVQSKPAAEANLAARHSLAGVPGSLWPSSTRPAESLHPESLQLPLGMPLPPPPSWRAEVGNGRRPHMYGPRAHRLASYKPPGIEDVPDEDGDKDYEHSISRKGQATQLGRPGRHSASVVILSGDCVWCPQSGSTDLRASLHIQCCQISAIGSVHSLEDCADPQSHNKVLRRNHSLQEEGNSRPGLQPGPAALLMGRQG